MSKRGSNTPENSRSASSSPKTHCRACDRWVRKKGITKENALAIYTFARGHGCLAVSDQCVDVVLLNLDWIRTTQQFVTLEHDEIEYLAKRNDEKKLQSSKVLLIAVLQWVQEKPEERKRLVTRMFPSLQVVVQFRDLDLQIPLRKSFVPLIFEGIEQINCLDPLDPRLGSPILDQNRKLATLNTGDQPIFTTTDEERSPVNSPCQASGSGASTSDNDTLSPVGGKRFRRAQSVVSVVVTANESQPFSEGDLEYIAVSRPLANNVTEVKPEPVNVAGSKKSPLIYFVRKSKTKKLCSYHLELREVKMICKYPHLGQESCLKYHNGRIYDLGGYKLFRSQGRAQTGIDEGGERMCKITYTSFDRVSILDLRSKTWINHNLSPLTYSRAGFHCEIVKDFLYVFAGWNSEDKSDSVSYNDVEKIQLDENKSAVANGPPKKRNWELVSYLKHPRDSYGLCTLGNRIYVIGGYSADRNKGVTRATQAVESCDTETFKWEVMTSMPTARMGLAVATARGKIYALGGGLDYRDADQKFNVVEVYDPSTDSWETGVPMINPRLYFSAVATQNFIYAIGGDTSYRPTVERFNIDRQIWEVTDSQILPVDGVYNYVASFVQSP